MSAVFPIFLSVIVVLRNEQARAESLLRGLTEKLQGLAQDYEVIVIDNASEDESIDALKALTAVEGLPNLQVFALTKEVDADTAVTVGLENALGDFVCVIDPDTDDAGYLPTMLDAATKGADVVFAANDISPPQSLTYRVFSFGFNTLYRWFAHVHLSREAPLYRVLSRSLVNFILQHPRPAIAYRTLPATGGFQRARLHYRFTPPEVKKRQLFQALDRGVRVLVTTTRGPMRLASLLCLFGAAANLLYCFYVLGVALLMPDVAPGWVTLSLQQSGMFFLISLVLLVLSEYVMQMASLSSQGPAYMIAQEFTSAKLVTDRARLNVERVA